MPIYTVKQVRRQEAEKRQAAYDALTTEQKIARAEAAPGESKRELARLRLRLAKEQASAAK